MPHRKDLEGESGRFKSEGSGAETGDQKNSAKRFPKNGVFSQTLIMLRVEAGREVLSI